MDCYTALTLVFFGFCFSSCSHLPKRKYYYIDSKRTWTDAQQYCREKYTDLATIESMDDISWLEADSFSKFCKLGCSSWWWIGLRDDPNAWRGVMGHEANSWRWSATGETSKTSYQNWKETQPDSEDADQNCVAMTTNGKWLDVSCTSLRTFVCYTATNQGEKTYVFISTLKTWTSAQTYCREHHTDLAVIENLEENNEVRAVKPASVGAWIGLYRVPWTWSDKSQSSFRSWLGDQPNNYGGQFCAAENSEHEWKDDDCHIKLNFICHRATILKTTLRMKIQTDADITDPAANAQILQQVGAVLTSQGWTGFNLQWKIQPRKQETKESANLLNDEFVCSLK